MVTLDLKRGRASTLEAYQDAEHRLLQAWDAVKHRHASKASHDYITAHWSRYVYLLSSFQAIPRGTKILEVGASIVASTLKLEGANVSVAYHELEREWGS